MPLIDPFEKQQTSPEFTNTLIDPFIQQDITPEKQGLVDPFKKAEESKSNPYLDQFIEPPKRVLDITGEEANAGIRTIKEGIADSGTAELRLETEPFGKLRKVLVGGIQTAFSGATGLARGLVGEPVQATLESAGVSQETSSFVGNFAGDAAFILGPAGIAKLSKLGKIPVPEVQVKDAERLSKIKPLKTTPEELLKADLTDKAGNIKLSNINTTDDVKKVLSGVAETNIPELEAARRGVIKNSELERIAKSVDLEALTQRKVGEALNAEQILKARTVLINSADDLFVKAKTAFTGDDKQLLEFEKSLTRHVAIQEQVSGATAEAGRALQQFNIKAAGDKARVKIIKEMIESKGGHTGIKKIAEKLAELDSPEKISKFANEAYKASTSDKILEAWINALLSGPQTHAVNTISNTLVATWTIPENIVAAGIGKFHGGEKIFMREPIQRAFGLIEGAKDGMILAAKAFKTETPSDALSKIESNRYQAIDGVLGKIVRTPGRFLMAEDEFFKAIGYRMEVNARAVRQAASEGLKGRNYSKRVNELKLNPPENVVMDAIDTARYQTFTKPLGDTGKSVQRFAASHPALRLIFPFIRTPANIVKFAGERTPFSIMSKAVREEAKTGNIKRDILIARAAMGTGISAAVMSYALDGSITGGGPTNSDARRAMFNTGWMPYSIRVGDNYYSYSRLEPLGMLFGISADLAEIGGELDDKDIGDITGAVLSSVSKNITSKTWLRGASNVIETMSDPDRYGKSFLLNFAGTLIPSGVSQLARVQDPVLRSISSENPDEPALSAAQELINKLKSRIPGYSKDLPPRTNIWGEVIALSGGVGPDIISPVYQSLYKNDKVNDEIVRLDINVKMPKKKIGKVKLSGQEYFDFTKMAGEPAKKRLDDFVKSKIYKKIPDFKKKEKIQEIIFDNRKRARRMMLKNNPRILNKVVANRKENATQIMKEISSLELR